MPIYKLICENGHELELMQSIKKELPRECPKCGQPLNQVYGNIGVKWTQGPPTPKFH